MITQIALPLRSWAKIRRGVRMWLLASGGRDAVVCGLQDPDVEVAAAAARQGVSDSRVLEALGDPKVGNQTTMVVPLTDDGASLVEVLGRLSDPGMCPEVRSALVSRVWDRLTVEVLQRWLGVAHGDVSGLADELAPLLGWAAEFGVDVEAAARLMSGRGVVALAASCPASVPDDVVWGLLMDSRFGPVGSHAHWVTETRGVSSLLKWMLVNRPGLADHAAQVPALTHLLLNTPHWRPEFARLLPGVDWANRQVVPGETMVNTPYSLMALAWHPLTPTGDVEALVDIFADGADKLPNSKWVTFQGVPATRLGTRLGYVSDWVTESDPDVLSWVLSKRAGYTPKKSPWRVGETAMMLSNQSLTGAERSELERTLESQMAMRKQAPQMIRGGFLYQVLVELSVGYPQWARVGGLRPQAKFSTSAGVGGYRLDVRRDLGVDPAPGTAGPVDRLAGEAGLSVAQEGSAWLLYLRFLDEGMDDWPAAETAVALSS